MLQLSPLSLLWLSCGCFKPHQRGGGCCSFALILLGSLLVGCFKPHQRGGGCCSPVRRVVTEILLSCFKPHQRGGGCCSRPLLRGRGFHPQVSNPISGEVGAAAAGGVDGGESHACQFQTPSAGRWVLQLQFRGGAPDRQRHVSNPISGEVGAAASRTVRSVPPLSWVSNPISGEVGAAASHTAVSLTARRSFKPHQRGGGCCSTPNSRKLVGFGKGNLVSNPISGEVGAAAKLVKLSGSEALHSFKPHQRGGGCCSPPFISSSLFKELNTRFREPPPPGGGGSGACHRLRSAEAM